MSDAGAGGGCQQEETTARGSTQGKTLWDPGKIWKNQQLS